MPLRWISVLVALPLLASACGGGAGPGPTPTAQVQAPTPEPTPTAVPTPTPEPAVETLAFIDDGDLWLVNADGSNRQRITQFGGSDREVAGFEWLANGQEIAYRVSSPSDSDTFTSVLASLDGRVLWERERGASRTGVFWSPDGELVSVFDGTDVSIEERDGRSVWTGSFLPNPSSSRASWSADSNHLAFVDGDEIVVVSRHGMSVSRLSVSYDTVPTTEKLPCHPIPPDANLVLGRPVFRADGKTIFVAVNCSENQGTAGLFNTTIREVSLDGLIDRRVTEPNSWVTGLPSPSFSPDGRLIALLEGARGVYCPHGDSAAATMDLDILDPQGGDRSQLVPREIAQLVGDLAAEGRTADMRISGRLFPWWRESPPVWSPASDAILTSFSATECVLDEDRPQEVRGEHRLLAEGIYLLRIDGLADETVADEFSEAVSWSPSGGVIVYATGGDFISRVSGEPSAPQIRVFDLVTREVTDLGPGHSPAWQPLAPDAATLPWEGEVTDNLRIRSEPNTASDTVGLLPKGTKVRVYGEAEGEEAEAGSGNRTWYRVIGGYVYSASVER